jgi:hypothetical protein
MTARTSFAAGTVLMFLATGLSGAAEPQKANGWILNDLSAAQSEARKTGKPIFVTIRCEA